MAHTSSELEDLEDMGGGKDLPPCFPLAHFTSHTQNNNKSIMPKSKTFD